MTEGHTPGLGGGSTIGPFHLGRVLGSGCFGTVYNGIDQRTGERVAIKLLDQMGGPTDGIKRQLLAEAGALRAVLSPNTLRVVDVIESQGQFALVTEFVEGAPLRTILDAHGHLTGPQALTVLRGSAAGLAAVHAAGLTHGDVKPANILVEPSGNSKLIDFGLVSLPGWIAGDSASPWGSPAYAPPEQVLHEYRDHRSDIYSLTVTLYEVLCGRRPFLGSTIEEVRSNHVYQPLPDPRLFVPDLGDGLTQLLFWGLAKNPDERPQDVSTWLHYLEAGATARYGSTWWAADSLAVIVGGLTVGGLLASGVLVGAGQLGSAVGAAAASGATAGSAASASASGSAGAAGSAVTASAGTGATATSVGTAKVGIGAAIASKTGAVVAAGAVAVAAVGGGAAYVASHKKVEMIAFSRCSNDVGQDCSIYTIHADGTGAARLGAGMNPVWSPDGTHIAYSQSTSSNIGTPDYHQEISVHVMKADGTDDRRLASQGEWPSGVAWSPDGKRLAFPRATKQSLESQLVVINADGSGQRVLDADEGGVPAWSPDGKRLAYLAEATGIGDCWNGPVYTIGAGGEGKIKTGVNTTTGALSWLPDGRHFVAYQDTSRSSMNCSSNIVRASATTREKVKLVEGALPAVSPDGKQIAYASVSESGDAKPVWVMNADGSSRHRIGEMGWAWPQPVWSHDGSEVAYTSQADYDKPEQIMISSASGSGSRRLTEGSQPSWGMVDRTLVKSLQAAPATRCAKKDRPATSTASYDVFGTETGRLTFVHPGWGEVTLVASAEKGDYDTNEQIFLTAFDEDGHEVWSYDANDSNVPLMGNEEWKILGTDDSCNLYIGWNPGRYEGVSVLHPTPDGFESYGTLPKSGDYSEAAFYYAEIKDTDDDGVNEILQSTNDCDPDCAGGTITTETFRWNGHGWRGRDGSKIPK